MMIRKVLSEVGLIFEGSDKSAFGIGGKEAVILGIESCEFPN
jgi:hypothetical protein